VSTVTQCMKVVLAACGLALAGCGAQGMLLGTAGDYLLTASDVLATPGREVQLRARLQGGDLLRAQPGYVVRFYRNGRLFKAAETGENGVAEVSFTPPEPGDYRFLVDVAPVGLPDDVPEEQRLLVACRRADRPMAVVDMDKTIVASGFHMVLIGQPAPMPGSAEVLRRLAETHTIVYLTHRPDYFGPKSKAWLEANSYPPGPVLLSSVKGFLAGSGAFKSAMLARLKEHFGRIEIGIGDKASDATAYHENGLKSFLVYQLPASEDAAAIGQLAESLGRCPEQLQAVTSWRQIEQVLFEGASFPVRRAEARLKQAAARLRQAAERLAETQQDTGADAAGAGQ